LRLDIAIDIANQVAPSGWLMNGCGAVPSRGMPAAASIALSWSPRRGARRDAGQRQPRSMTPDECPSIFHLFGMMPWERDRVHC
jgi:hypothetical protein